MYIYNCNTHCIKSMSVHFEIASIEYTVLCKKAIWKIININEHYYQINTIIRDYNKIAGFFKILVTNTPSQQLHNVESVELKAERYWVLFSPNAINILYSVISSNTRLQVL